MKAKDVKHPVKQQRPFADTSKLKIEIKTNGNKIVAFVVTPKGSDKSITFVVKRNNLESLWKQVEAYCEEILN